MSCSPMPCKNLPSCSGNNADGTPSNGAWVLAATVLGSSMEFIDGTVVNLALPSMQRSFLATGTGVQWVVEAYALSLSALILVGGALGDRFGLRRTFLIGVGIFACASVLCGLASSIAELVAARFLQGVGGALLVPNSLALLSATFSGAARGRAIGTWSGFASIMTALGPLLGGWLVQHGSWRWVFFLNVPIAILTTWITLRKTSLVQPASVKAPIDVKGAVLATGGLSGLTFCFMNWSTGPIEASLTGILGAASLVAFLLVERKAVAPMMPTTLFASRSFSGANVLTFFLYAALSGTLFYLPLNLIQVQRYSPTQAGAAMLPLVAILFLLSRWAGGLVERYGARTPLVLGPMIAACGYVLLARPGLGGSYWATYFPAIVVLGFGMAVSVAPLTTVVMNSVPVGNEGSASGVNNAVSQTAALLALALSAPLFFHSFSSELGKKLNTGSVPLIVVQQVKEQEGRLGAIETPNSGAKRAVDEAFVASFRLIALLASTSAAAASITAALTIRRKVKPRQS